MGRNSKQRRDAKKNKTLKDKNRLKIKTRATPHMSSGPVMSLMENPFSDISDEQRENLIYELSKNGQDKVIECLASLDAILRQYDPITLVTIISGHGLTVGVGNNGVKSKESSSGLNQSHVELIQALALQIPENELGTNPVIPEVVQKACEHLIELAEASSISRMDVDILKSSKKDKAIMSIQERVRGHTQMVRNWGFHAQIVKISKEMYSPFDTLTQNKLGFSATEIIDVFEILIVSVEKKLSSRLQALSEIKSIKKPLDMLVKYHELIGQGKAEAEKFADQINVKKIGRESLFYMLLAHYDLRMPDTFIINKDEILSQLTIKQNALEKILAYFSYGFGDLANFKKEYFFLNNPVWKKPIIRDAGQYYCALPQLFFSFVLNTLDEVIQEFNKEALHNRRSQYLEFKIEEVVKTRFPESQVVSGIKWSKDGVQYETDLIAFIDSHVIIIEAKSHKISMPALRGAPERIKKHLNEVLINPGLQSYRLEQKLNELRSQDSPKDSLLAKLPVDIKSIKKVLRVSVSLEDFATLQASLGLFDDTDWIPAGFVPCPSMNLADFETLFDFLEHPVQIIHYLSRRSEIERKYNFFGDELDYMGLYITTLLNVGNMVKDDSTDIIISGMSDPLDIFYMSKEQGVILNKPQPNISPLFRKIFKKLEERATPRWTEIGCILNHFPPDDQIKVMKYIKDFSEVVNKTWQVEGHKSIIVYSPPETSEYALTVVLFKNENRDRRYEFIESASALGLEPKHVSFCLTIAINIDNDDSPYHYIGLAESEEE